MVNVYWLAGTCSLLKVGHSLGIQVSLTLRIGRCETRLTPYIYKIYVFQEGRQWSPTVSVFILNIYLWSSRCISLSGRDSVYVHPARVGRGGEPGHNESRWSGRS